MNSIFVRIYGGILVALLIIGALTYVGVDLVNQYRSDQYRERVAHGTFYLMAESCRLRADGQSRAGWARAISTRLGMPVAVLTADALDLSYREALYLGEGRVVFRSIPGRGAPLQQEPVQALYALSTPGYYLSVRADYLSLQQARATATLVKAYLLARAPGEQADALARLNRKFGYPLSLVSRRALNLNAEGRDRLAAGSMVFALSADAGVGARLLAPLSAPLPDGRSVLVLGPLFPFDPFPLPLLLIAGLAALVLVALATYLQVRPLQRRLRRLDQAVKRLGSGDLTAHAEVPGNDPIGQVAATFNGMTAHIRRLIEAQRELTRAVSHELRTPVVRLRFGLEMLAEEELAERRQDKFEDLDRDIDELDHLIDEILTYARLEEGTPNIVFQAVHPREISERLRSELDGMHGDVRIEVLGPEAVTLQADPRYLHRVLQNLVTNALRYARSRVAIRLDEAGGCVILDVEDDGPGIPESERVRVLKPFARLEGGRHRDGGGYGLGLSIVKRIIDWHGGEMRVEESLWGGARFRVILPREQRDPHVLIRDRRPFG